MPLYYNHVGMPNHLAGESTLIQTSWLAAFRLNGAIQLMFLKVSATSSIQVIPFRKLESFSERN
jgi:hypothetical protein